MIRFFTFSEPGGHAENEDAFEVRVLTRKPDCYLCAVADGQGGHAGGALAAKIACRALLDAAAKHEPAQLLLPTTWTKISRLADEAVVKAPAAGLTTLIGFCITDSVVCGSSCGDSAAFLLNAYRPAEILTARQHKNPPVGSGAAPFVDFFAALQRPWILLAMSDGVWKYAGWEGIAQSALCEHDEGLIHSLRQRAKLPVSKRLQDDFTLVIFQDWPN